MKSFAQESCGATTIEYALIASLISIVIIAGVQQIGTKLAGFFNIASYL
jgi:Flp pilus assembly pilin Flp